MTKYYTPKEIADLMPSWKWEGDDLQEQLLIAKYTRTQIIIED